MAMHCLIVYSASVALTEKINRRTTTITLTDDIPVGKHRFVLVVDKHIKDDPRQQRNGYGIRKTSVIEWDRRP